jgi:hypothetical protein
MVFVHWRANDIFSEQQKGGISAAFLTFSVLAALFVALVALQNIRLRL